MLNEPWFWRIFLAVVLVAAIVCRITNWYLPGWLFWPVLLTAVALHLRAWKRSP